MGINSYRNVNCFKVCEYFAGEEVKCRKGGTQECSRICVYASKN